MSKSMIPIAIVGTILYYCWSIGKYILLFGGMALLLWLVAGKPAKAQMKNIPTSQSTQVPVRVIPPAKSPTVNRHPEHREERTNVNPVQNIPAPNPRCDSAQFYLYMSNGWQPQHVCPALAESYRQFLISQKVVDPK